MANHGNTGDAIRRKAFSCFARLERLFARCQGKGWGTGTVRNEVYEICRLLGGRPQLAIDVGGNVGNYSWELKKLNPEIEIHVFEPSEVNVSKLRERFAGDRKMQVVKKALSDVSGNASLFSDAPGSGLGSLFKRNLSYRGIDFDCVETVETIDFLSYWKGSLKSRPVDIVKIDVEGFELKVLKGFGEAINYTKAIQFEFGGTDLDTRTIFKDFWDFFEESGFAMFRVTPFGLQRLFLYSEFDECYSTTNYIAVKSS